LLGSNQVVDEFRIVRKTGKPIAQIARDLGVHPGTLGNWVAKDRAEHEGTQGLSRGDVAELKRLRAENAQLPEPGAKRPVAFKFG
jgi:transposase-like protein